MSDIESWLKHPSLFDLEVEIVDSAGSRPQPLRRRCTPVPLEGRWFACWFLVGAAAGFGVIGLLSIGPLVLAAAAVGAVALSIRQAPRRGLPGVVAGPGLPLLYVAYLNRGGPGTVCTTTLTEQTCTDEWSPWPWVITAVLLVAGSAVHFRFQRTRLRCRRPARRS